MIDFGNISYLKYGSSRQRMAYEVLSRNFIFEKIKKYNPVLAGTIPINIDIWNSDMDILCHWSDEDDFILDITRNFQTEENFKIKTKNIRGKKAVISNFRTDGFEIEIFGQDIPVKQQYAYRHMLIEYNLLMEKGEDFRNEIIMLKNKGFKTEPAFAELLGLKGDPFEELLKFEK